MGEKAAKRIFAPAKTGITTPGKGVNLAHDSIVNSTAEPPATKIEIFGGKIWAGVL